MKKIQAVIAKAILIYITLIVVVSCRDMDDNYKQYLEKGEVNYSNKVEDLFAYAGDGRVGIQGSIYNGFNVKEIVVEWHTLSGELKEKVVPYQRRTDLDTIQTIISELPYGTYEFKVFSRDNEGNPSVAGKVFGSSLNYKKIKEDLSFSLREPNVIKKVAIDSKDFRIYFLPNKELQRKTQIKYFSTEGDMMISEIQAWESSTTLTKLDASKPIQWKTFYGPLFTIELPDGTERETVMDFYETDWSDVKSIQETEHNFRKRNWYAVASSSYESNTIAAKAIDGRNNTFWASQDDNYPHTFTVDTKENNIIKSVVVGRVNHDTYKEWFPKKFRIEFSDDKKEWHSAQEFTAEPLPTMEHEYILSQPVQARYFRFVAIEKAIDSGVVGISEIYVKGDVYEIDD